LNNFSSFLNVSENFELDYWGASTKNVAKFLYKEKLDKNSCIISNRNEALGYFLKKSRNHNCFISFRNLDKKNPRPFYVALMERKLNKGVPNKCAKIYEEKIQLNLSKEKIVLAKVFKCD
jgi:GTP-sensing pleiotropic transcriptional regulator CodY